MYVYDTYMWPTMDLKYNEKIIAISLMKIIFIIFECTNILVILKKIFKLISFCLLVLLNAVYHPHLDKTAH